MKALSQEEEASSLFTWPSILQTQAVPHWGEVSREHQGKSITSRGKRNPKRTGLLDQDNITLRVKHVLGILVDSFCVFLSFYSKPFPVICSFCKFPLGTKRKNLHLYIFLSTDKINGKASGHL